MNSVPVEFSMTYGVLSNLVGQFSIFQGTVLYLHSIFTCNSVSGKNRGRGRQICKFNFWFPDDYIDSLPYLPGIHRKKLKYDLFQMDTH